MFQFQTQHPKATNHLGTDIYVQVRRDVGLCDNVKGTIPLMLLVAFQIPMLM